jgi:hypothetical protein
LCLCEGISSLPANLHLFPELFLGFGISLGSEVICTVEVRCLSRASVVEFVWGSLFFHVFFLDVHCFLSHS